MGSVLAEHIRHVASRYARHSTHAMSYHDIAELYNIDITAQLHCAGIGHTEPRIDKFLLHSFPRPVDSEDTAFVEYLMPYAPSQNMVRLRKMNVYMPAQDSFRLGSTETQQQQRFLRARIKTAYHLTEKRCPLCGGEICKEKHSCSFFSVGLVSNKGASTQQRLVLTFVEYILQPTPAVLLYIITPHVVMAACCSIIQLVCVLEDAAISAAATKNMPSIPAPIPQYALPGFLQDTLVDMHCLQKTVAFYSATVLSRYYDTPQLRALQTLLLALGEAILKHGCAKPLVKPFANENVQGVDLQTFYVKNPLKNLILLLHTTRVFMHEDVPATPIIATVSDNAEQSLHMPLLSEMTGIPQAQLATILVPWTADYAARFAHKYSNINANTCPLLLQPTFLTDTRVLQLLYAVRCFFHRNQRVFFGEKLSITRIDLLTRRQQLELQIRFLWVLLQNNPSCATARDFDANDVMQIVAK